MNAAVIYYTDNSLAPQMQNWCLKALERETCPHPLVDLIVVSQFPLNVKACTEQISLGRKKRCLQSMYEQILVGIDATDADIIILAEHDCLYPPSRFNVETWRDGREYLTYNANMYWMSELGFFTLQYGPRLSQLYGPRETVHRFYLCRHRPAQIKSFSYRLEYRLLYCLETNEPWLDRLRNVGEIRFVRIM